MQRSGLAAEAYLNYVARTTQLTERGKQWLKQAIDPMHDLTMKPDGYPDVKIAPSVSQLVKQTFNIKKPTTLPAGNWDLHLFNFPWWTVDGMQAAQVDGNVISSGPLGASTWSLGGIVSLAGAEGEDLWTESGPNTDAVVQSYGLDPAYFEGATRVTGAGFEAVNTTSKLYKQGQVIVYRQSQANFQQKVMSYFDLDLDINPRNRGCGSYVDVRPPPYNTAEAMLFTGSKQWEAADGAYCTISFNSLDLPADSESVIDPIIWTDAASSTESGVQTAVIPTPYSATTYWPGHGTGSALGALSPALTCMCPQDMSGMYFAGLSEQTTISLTLNIFLERFPSQSESDLVTLAGYSPPYDVFAQQIYTYCLLEMPPGVPAYMNGFGDWFASVVSKVGGAVSKIAGGIPHPIAQAVSQGAGALSGAANLFSDTPNTRVNTKLIKQQEKQAESRPYISSVPLDIPRLVDKDNDRDRQQDNAIRKLRRREEALSQELKALKNRVAKSGNTRKGKK